MFIYGLILVLHNKVYLKKLEAAIHHPIGCLPLLLGRVGECWGKGSVRLRQSFATDRGIGERKTTKELSKHSFALY